MSRTRTQKRRLALAGVTLSLFLMATGSLPPRHRHGQDLHDGRLPCDLIAGTSRTLRWRSRTRRPRRWARSTLTVPPLLTITGATASQGTVTPAGNLLQVRSVGLLAGRR